MNKKYIIFIGLFVEVLLIINKTRFLIILAVFIMFAALLLWSSRSFFYRMKAAKANQEGNVAEAARLLKKAYDTGIASPKTIISYAYYEMRNGNIDAAEKILTTLNSKNRDESIRKLIVLNYSIIKWKRGDLEGAINLLEKLKSEYTTTTLYGTLGYYYIESGDINKALEFNKEAYEYNDQDMIIIDNYAHSLFLSGQSEKAYELCQKLMEKNPVFPSAYFLYGQVLEALMYREKAREAYTQALSKKFSALSTVSKEEIENKLAGLDSV